jgi:hypothetical protein
MSDVFRVQVLLRTGEAERFERYCQERGYKKSTLIARLVREHLDREGFEVRPMAMPRRAVG